MRRRQGFTIIELMIATSVFSVVLITVVVGVMAFTRAYYRGVNSGNTQTVARNVVSEISQSLQFGNSLQTLPNGYCINGHAYFYSLGYEIGGTGSTGGIHALVAGSNCPQNDSPFNDIHNKCLAGTTCGGGALPLQVAGGMDNQRELLSSRMRLVSFNVDESDAEDGIYDIDVMVAFGDDDLLCGSKAPFDSTGCAQNPATFVNDPKLHCRDGDGDQFCAVVHLTASVARRLQPS